MRQFVIASILLTAFFPNAAFADRTFLERFALAKDRDTVLKDLIPGTQEYYYFHCLHYQNTQTYAQAAGSIGICQYVATASGPRQ
ncbi:MAG TPA: hypothetical protein EYG03_14990 [Planctomycetes bacterium]|nr:hypothetical protein [Fuerstiella sp.]HIK93266.1 hypothetical protein [Planctomycetota bacterium]